MINQNNRQKGMTLLELMVVLAIGSIVVMMAIPSFSRMNAHLNLKGAGQTMVMDFRRAQSLAVRLNALHRINFTLNTPVVAPDGLTYNGMYQVSCTANCSATDSLPPARYLGTPTGTASAASAGTSNSPGVSLVSTTDGTPAAATTLDFSPNGYVTTPGTLPFTVTMQSMQTGETICVQVFKTGRITTSLITPPAVC